MMPLPTRQRAPLLLLLGLALISTVRFHQMKPVFEDFQQRGFLIIASNVSENAGKQRHDEQEQEQDRRPVAEPEETEPEQQQQQEKQPHRSREEAEKQQKGPLNIVLFYADDWSFETLGAMGNTYVQTPVLDKLAKEGVLFTHNCVTTSICMQSRATLYTGQYSSRHQTLYAWRNVTMYEPDRWNNTLYPLMMKAGYNVGFFGKYHHLEPPPRNIPTFSEWRSYQVSHYITRNGIEKHITQWNEEDGIEFLKKPPKDQPFFLTVSFFATHAEDGSQAQYRPMNSSMHLYQDAPVPLPKTYTEKHFQDMPYFIEDGNHGRARFLKRYRTPKKYQHHMKNTLRMVTEVDAACGRMMDLLKEQGVIDNTLIIFTTDNGNMHGQHGLAEKWFAYEESLRVPLIIKDPRIPSSMIGTKNDEFTLNIDLAPTILTAAGVTPPDVMQGRDLAPLYRDPVETAKTWRKEFFYEFRQDNDWLPNSVALVGKDFKYILWEDHNYTQYFNLLKDPLEEDDLFNRTDTAVLLQARKRMLELEEIAKSFKVTI